MRITRRLFGWMAAVFLSGCSTKRVSIGVVQKPSREQAIDAICQRHELSGVALDPLLLGLLLNFLFGLLQQCLLQNVLKKHRLLNRKPGGIVAARMAEQIRDRFVADNPDADPAVVASHVYSSLKAFREATTEEIVRLCQEVKSTYMDPTVNRKSMVALANSIESLTE